MLYHKDIFHYYGKMKEETLKYFFQIILKNQEKTEYLIIDLIGLYNMFEDTIITLKMEILWTPELNRHKLQMSILEPPEKKSEIMKKMRLRNSVKKYSDINYLE